MRVTKWGNSLGIHLPKLFAVQIGIEAGCEVDIEIRHDSIVIANPKRSLDHLLSTITPAMLHGETETGMTIGQELW